MINRKLLDLYTDYLISSFSLATATGLSELTDKVYSHDTITRFLSSKEFTQKTFWKQIVKPALREIENEEGVIIIDDTIEEKPHTKENEIICYHYDHSKSRSVKGINIINFLYHSEVNSSLSIPLAFKAISKTEEYIDKKSGKLKRKSSVTKNEIVRERLKILTFTNHINYKYILWDSWFSSKENLNLVHSKLKKHFVCAVKSNRTVALSKKDKLNGNFIQVSALNLEPETTCLVYIKGNEFPIILAKQVFTNKDRSTGTLYLISNDTELNYQQLTTIYQKRWKVEVFHKSLKQNALLEKSPTKTPRTQKNHIFASMVAFIKLESMKLKNNLNHFALKRKLYIKAIKSCFSELQKLKTDNKNFQFKSVLA